MCHLLPRLSDPVLGAPLAVRASWRKEQEGPGPCLSEEGLGRAGSGERLRGSTGSRPPSGCSPRASVSSFQLMTMTTAPTSRSFVRIT